MTTDQIKQIVLDAAAQYGIDQDVALAQIWIESRFNPNAVSPAGAQGLAQFVPATWSRFGSGSPYDPSAAMQAWGRYMTYLLGLSWVGGDIWRAIGAYNEGEGGPSTTRGLYHQVSLYGANWLDHAPTETRNYVNSIMSMTGQVPYPAGSSSSPGAPPAPPVDTTPAPADGAPIDSGASTDSGTGPTWYPPASSAFSFFSALTPTEWALAAAALFVTWELF